MDTEHPVATSHSFRERGIYLFNLDSAIRRDPVEESGSLRSFCFAHKFYTCIEKKKDAALTVLPDGTKVWQIYIHSKGAYSINVLLTDFELPQGGKLFVYNEDHSHVVGSFDYRNNSPDKIIPIQPVAGESIIIEYSEPVGVSFEGNFTVSEVNHDYRDFLRRGAGEPGNDKGGFLCMPDALCADVDESLVRSTVLLMINGTTACSGVLLNNTENDGAPYILTAVHCLNGSLQDKIYMDMNQYTTIAGTVIAFFNYNRPVCETQLKGTEEMSVARAVPLVILEKKDVALLELHEEPPSYYNAYYAGWNMWDSPTPGTYSNLHHPEYAPKKYGKTAATNLSTGTCIIKNDYPDIFDANSHWKVAHWDEGSTAAGSSGSPLFDEEGRVVGALTGGASECDGTSTNHASDYFSKLSMSWETGDADNQLKTYLDPSGTGLKQQAGKDPNSDKPLFRMSNADFSAGDMLEVKMSDFTEAIEFAEEFTLKSEVEILGTYILVPPLSSNRVTGVEISIYSGVNSPENLLQTQSFSPQYMNYSSATGFNPRDKTMTGFGTESFVLFDESVKIAGKFFISYKINSPNSFYIYNTKFADEYKQNTAWVKDPSQGWLQVPDWLPGQSEKTSLAIQPLVRGITGNNAAENNDCPLFFDSKSHTLVLTEPASEPILVKVYSHTGALMEKTQIGKGERSVSLAEKTKGTIGIIGLLLSNKFYSGKILY